MPASDHFVRVNELRLRYRHWGHPTRAPVVLLHGGSAHAHWWDFFAPAIAEHYRIVALDLRGHGDSEHPEPPAYGLENYVDDLGAFIEVSSLQRVTLIGHSLGGMIATAYSAALPQRVHSLVVVDSSLKMTPAGAHYMHRLRRFPQPVYNSRADALRRFGLLPASTRADAMILEHIAGHGVRQLPDGRWTLKFDRAALAHHQPHDLTPALQRVRCPILFVRGAHSTVLTPAMLATLLTAAPHAEVVEISDAHHHVMLDNPAAFALAVHDFLDRTHRIR